MTSHISNHSGVGSTLKKKRSTLNFDRDSVNNWEENLSSKNIYDSFDMRLD